MSDTTIYKRKVCYTLKDGTVKTKYYDFVYHKKPKRITKLQIRDLKTEIRASILELNNHADLLKLQAYIENLKPDKNLIKPKDLLDSS